MPKYITLSNAQLKEICAAHDLLSSGNKAVLVERLVEETGSDEVDSAVLANILMTPNKQLQTQMDKLQAMMETVLKRVNDGTKGNQKSTEDDHNVSPNENMEEADSEIFEQESVDESEHKSMHLNFAAETRTKYSIKDIAQTLPEYDPTNELSVSAEQFIEHIEGTAEAYDWEEKCLLLAVYTQLKGAARLWYNGRIKLFGSWAEFRKALLDEFGTTLDEAEIGYKMNKAIRRPDEKIIDYCFRMSALGKRFGLSESAIIKYTREGLRHRDLQNAIAPIKFASAKMFRESITEYLDNMPSTSRHLRDQNSSNKSFQRFEQRETTKEATKTRDVICYNCQDKGHLSRNCPRPQRRERCRNCHRTSHKTEDCRQTTSDNQSRQPNVNTIAETADTYNDVIKKIRLNERHFTAFMDSGSPWSFIREKCLRYFDQREKCSKTLTGFAGGRYTTTTKVHASAEVDQNLFHIQLFVVKNEDIPEDVLVGRDVMCRDGTRFIIEKEGCRVEKVDDKERTYLLDTQQTRDLQELLTKNRDCFAEDMNELGKCSVEKMKIQLKTDEPIFLKPYRVPFAKREIIGKIISDLLSCNLIRESKSKYASPVVLVAKNNGEHRLCVDYRCLNKVTFRTPFPMPLLEEQFAHLASNNVFTSLDLRMGYHQIEMDESSKQFTAFVTTDGHYEYNRMPFGLVDAPAIFQRVMNHIIAEMNTGDILVYLDDVVIPSKTVNEGMLRLEFFFNLLRKYGLTLRRDKCKFFEPTLEYLGHVISAHGIKPGNRKIEAIRKFETPKNITEVRRFLGLTGFFRKFVMNYAIITKPITKLLHKTESDKFIWANDQQNAFDNLVGILTNAPLLELYDATKLHEVHTDACAIELAGVLLQSADGETWRPVMYFSRHCTEAEQKYHSYELEVLAVVATLERFRLYLLGKSFHIVTDCSAIVQTKDKHELIPRVARWWLRMQEFDFELVHRQGSRLAHVDAMSRAPVEPPQSTEPAGFVYKVETENVDWVIALQHRDERSKLIMNVLRGKVKSPEEPQIKHDYKLIQDRLYRNEDGALKFYAPKAVRWQLVKHYHDDMGHFALERTLGRLTKTFWFPKMRKYVKEYIGGCIACCYNKTQHAKPEGTLHFDPPDPIPFKLLHIDHLGPFIRSRKMNTHILAMTDAFSKFCIIKAVRNTTTTPVINALLEVVSYFGLPARIVTDRGTAYTSKKFESFCRDHDIQHTKTAVRTPRANGQVERTNSVIINYLRTTASDTKDWDATLYKLQWSLNSQPNATTKFTPNELVFNFDITDVVRNQLVVAVQDQQPKTIEQLPAEQKRERALANISSERMKWKKRFDAKHSTPTQYKVGDLVVTKYEPPATGESRKLQPRYRGPYIVTRVIGKDRYLVEDVPGIQVTAKRFSSIFSSDLLKHWCLGYPDLTSCNRRDSDYPEETDPLDDGSPSEVVKGAQPRALNNQSETSVNADSRDDLEPGTAELSRDLNNNTAGQRSRE